jgi:hypothetical protein
MRAARRGVGIGDFARLGEELDAHIDEGVFSEGEDVEVEGL